ncbi:MAG TPA: hypothetical protein VLF69_01845 [Candidatus Saccharimonadales bacterium]|nr:hypothetical protein [Candidatus Saccharimonadales bacterium]
MLTGSLEYKGDSPFAYADMLGVDLAACRRWRYDNPGARSVDHDEVTLLRRAVDSEIAADALTGRLALTLWAMLQPSDYLKYYHGSYKSPAEIGPSLTSQQAVWFDSDGTKYADGVPAVALDDTVDVPIIRSLFHGNAPNLQEVRADGAPLLARRKDIDGVSHWFTTERALAQVALGRVYAVRWNPRWWSDGPQRYIDPDLGDRHEYRATKPLRYHAAVATSAADLPGSLVVIDEAPETVHTVLDLVAESHLKELVNAGVRLRTLSGEFPLRPLSAFPGLHVGR